MNDNITTESTKQFEDIFNNAYIQIKELDKDEKISEDFVKDLDTNSLKYADALLGEQSHFIESKVYYAIKLLESYGYTVTKNPVEKIDKEFSEEHLEKIDGNLYEELRTLESIQELL